MLDWSLDPGEVEPCINGRTVAVVTYFGFDVDGIVDRLVSERLPDGRRPG